MKPTQLDLLMLLAEEGAASKSVALSTTQAAKRLGVSQQTASRWMRGLLSEGLVAKSEAGLRLSAPALQKLERIRAVFSRKPVFSLEGVVVEGLKDGAYYMSMEEYRTQFQELLGFAPYAGTLNVRLLSPEDVKNRGLLSEKQGMFVKGFEKEGRVFGGVKAFPALLNGRVRVAVIMPIRTHHETNVVELIAPMRLRGRLRLKNGSRVTVEVEAS